MTREERLDLLKQIEKDIHVCSLESTFLDDAKSCAIHSAIEELEQDTVPFDLELYQAGLMDAPEGMIEVLDEIQAEIRHFMYDINPSSSESDYACNYILQIIDKYRKESEVRNGNSKK